jgi:Dolichyl-phosphate-mannose-protein mannosyltransferase
MELDARVRATLLSAILLLGFICRGSTFASPLLDLHSWRQADTAAISRNFVRDGLNPLRPRVDHIGPGGSSQALTGLELHAWFVAAISVALGHFETAPGRLLSSAYFVGSAWLLWSLARRRYGDGAALAGTIIYAFGFPLMLFFERAFMNEALLTLLGLAALHETLRYAEAQRWQRLAVALSSVVLIGAIKPTYLIVLGPVAGIFFERRGWRGLLAWELLLVFVLAGGSVIAWFSHIHAVVGTVGVSFGLDDKLVDLNVLFSWRYWMVIGRRLVKDVLGPLGVVAYVAGVVTAARTGRRMELFGLASFLAYLLVVVVGNAVHNYYQLAMMPVAAPTIALGLSALVTLRAPLTDARRDMWLRMAIVMLVAAGTSLARVSGSHSWFRVDWTKEHACYELPRLLKPDETVVFAGYNSPDILFCSDRRGWLLAPHESTPEAIEAARQRGAAVLVIAQEHRGPLPADTDVVLENPRFVAVRFR